MQKNADICHVSKKFVKKCRKNENAGKAWKIRFFTKKDRVEKEVARVRALTPSLSLRASNVCIVEKEVARVRALF